MNTELEDYLQGQLEKRKRMQDPEYTSLGGGANADIAGTNNLNNLYAVFADSASKAGSLGGKTADASSVQRFAQASGANNNQFLQGLRGEEDDLEKTRSKEEALTEYLMNKKMDKEKLSSNERVAGMKLAYDKEQDAAKLAIDEANRKADRGLKYAELKQKQESSSKPKETKISQAEFKDAGYGRRLEQANAVFDKLSDKGYDRTSVKEGLKSYFPKQLQSAELQKQEQAERNFVNAILRNESGAAISTSEFENARQQYFPRAGDTPEVLAQKKQNREQALAMFKSASGRAWDQVPSAMLADVKPKKSTAGQAFAGETSGPKPGDEEDGYVFLGGDAKDPASWKPKDEEE